MEDADCFELTVVIPTWNRPCAVPVAVASALGQMGRRVEVVVVDDASDPAVELPEHPRLRCLRLERHSGVAAARNTGLTAARGRWVTFLDDDDVLLPGMADLCLSALATSEAPPPVAVISAVEVVGESGQILERRRPPTHEKGGHFSLEPLPEGCSHVTKNTLVAERRLLLSLGGFDADLGSCEWIDLFFRLNPVCSVVGLPEVTYRLTRGSDRRFSRNQQARAIGFAHLLLKHADLCTSHPKGHADALLGEARMALAAGSWLRCSRLLARAFKAAPLHSTRVVFNPVRVFRSVVGLGSSG